jgi:Tfp pilus assembly protein PilN
VSTDAKAIIGTILAVAVALGGLLSGQIAGVNARIGDLANQISEMRTDIRRIDDRLRVVEVAFGKVDQRLETLERLHLPAPDADE